jgi:antitoxin (DNA-binding transcriptional repressor) of toxin-antitoxin stability system
MAQVISQRELRNDSAEIMRRLDLGESFVITRNGQCVGELTPLRRQRFISTDHFLTTMHNAPTIDPARFRADIDSVLDQDVNPRA